WGGLTTETQYWTELVQGVLALLDVYLIISLSCLAHAQTPSTPAKVGTIHGVVRSGNMPIPGAAVPASTGVGGSATSAWTNVDGSFSISVIAYGTYAVRVHMTAFADASQQVVIDDSHPNQQVNLGLTLASRAQGGDSQSRRTNLAGPRGFQRLSLAANGGG